MADEPLQCDAHADREADLDALAGSVRESYGKSQSSDETLRLVRRYVDHLLRSGPPEFLDAEYRDLLRAGIVENLDLGVSDPKVEKAVIDQLEALASGRACASTTPSREGVHDAGDPVEMFTGQFTWETVDARLRGAGLDLVFRRTYRHQAFFDGPLGSRWDHAYNLTLRALGGDIVRSTGALRDDTYRRHPNFGQAGFNYWVPPDGQHGIIVETGSSFSWVAPDGLRLRYEEDPAWPGAHRAQRVRDRFGNYLAFSYTDGLLSRIEVNHPHRFLLLGYDEANRIRQLRDHIGRRCDYEYDDHGDLVAFTTPATAQHPSGLTTRYEYTSHLGAPELRHNLLRVLDPAGRCYVENEYGTAASLLDFNRVVRQREGSGEHTFEYERVLGEFDREYDSLERPSIQVNHVDRNGVRVHHIYNETGNLLLEERVAAVEAGPRVLQQRYRYNRDGATVATISPQGRVRQFYYGRDDFIQRRDLGPNDDIVAEATLTDRERLAFGNLLAVVRRGRRLDDRVAFAAHGAWGDPLPHVLTSDSDDIIVKQTFEPEYQLLATVSDPRVTASADPRFNESPAYARQLTRYEYGALPARLLERVVMPDAPFPGPLPDGTTVLSPIERRYLAYDARGRLRRERSPEGTETTYDYFSGAGAGARDGHLSSTTRDANGAALTTGYEINEAGMVTAVVNPRGFRSRQVVDELDRTVEVISAGPAYRTRIRHDSAGLVARRERDWRDASGQPISAGVVVETFSYDVENHPCLETLGERDLSAHLATRRRYDAAGLLEAVRLPRGTEIHYQHDERSLLTQTRRARGTPLEAMRETRYDGDGLAIAEVDAQGAVTRSVRDAFGRQIRFEDPLGHVRQIAYDKRDAVVLERQFQRGPAGRYVMVQRMASVFDEHGRRIRETASLFRDPIDTMDPDGDPDREFSTAVAAGLVTAVETRFFYDRDGRLFRTVDALGRAATTEYDALGRVVVERDPDGNSVVRTYDANGNARRLDRHEMVRDPQTNAVLREDVFTTLQDYDDLDRRVNVTDGLGNTVRYGYDSLGHVVVVTEPLGNVTRAEFDAYGRRIRNIVEMTANGLGGGAPATEVVTRYEYDANGNLTAVVDARGAKSSLAYDSLDRLTASTLSDGSTEGWRYDREDRIVRYQRSDGLAVRTTRDLLGRTQRVALDLTALPAGITYPAGAATFEEYQYDGLARLRQHANDVCAVEIEVDSLGRRVEERVRFLAGGPTGVLKLERGFDLVGNRTRLTYPSGRSLAYDYDPLRRVIAIRSLTLGSGYPGSTGLASAHDIARFRYRGRRLARIDYGNGSTCALAYDGAARVISMRHQSAAGGLLLHIQHLYDAAGNRRLTRESPAPAALPNGARYRFDSTQRLTRIERLTLPAVVPADFAPPAAPLPAAALVGQQAVDAVLGPLAADPANFTFRYDALGNRTEERRGGGQPPIIYTSDLLSRYQARGLQGFLYDRNGNLTDDGAFRWEYDYRNQLVRVENAALGATALELAYDALGRLVRVSDGGGVTSLVLDGANVVSEYRGAVLARHFTNGDRIDHRIQAVAGGVERWIHLDETGSTRLLTNTGGQLVAASRCAYDPFGALLTTATPPIPFLFCGKRFLDTVGIYDSRARQYSPLLGRFLQRDPAGRRDDLNVYTYAGNNPVSFVDPMGTDKHGTGSAIQKAAGAGVQETALQADFRRVSQEYDEALNGTSGEARKRVHKEYQEKLRLLRQQAIRQGNVEGWRFAGFAYAVGVAGALGSMGGWVVGLGVAEWAGLGTVGTFVTAGTLSGLTSAASSEVVQLPFGKPDVSGSALVCGAGMGALGGLAASWFHYYSFPVNTTPLRGKPGGDVVAGKYGWQFVQREGGGVIGPPIGEKIDPDLPPVQGQHRAHFHGYFIGGDNATFYSAPRVNTSYMKVAENAAARFAQGGNLQAITLRGGGYTSLNWSAWTSGGEPINLGVVDVLDQGLPTLAPLLKQANMSVAPGTTIWTER